MSGNSQRWDHSLSCLPLISMSLICLGIITLYLLQRLHLRNLAFFHKLHTSQPNSSWPFTNLKFIISLGTVSTFGVVTTKQHWKCLMLCREDHFRSNAVSFLQVCNGSFKHLLHTLFCPLLRRAVRPYTTKQQHHIKKKKNAISQCAHHVKLIALQTQLFPSYIHFGTHFFLKYSQISIISSSSY